jgi:DNA repair protein RadC
MNDIIQIQDIHGNYQTLKFSHALNTLHECITAKYNQERPQFSNPTVASKEVTLLFGHLEREAFMVVFLDNDNRYLAHEFLFYGTLDSATVYPREVVKSTLKHNAASVILAHNHPSGNTTPSNNDINLTTKLRTALSMIDVRVLDHLIIGSSVLSMAECGLI